MSKKTSIGGEYYDENAVRSISILDVCRMLGIKVIEKGGSYWCKIRDERTASCKLYTDRIPNTFYDYGGDHIHGDVINLTMHVCNLSWKDALCKLGRDFGIANTAGNDVHHSTDLSNLEYTKIGLYGDKATKNFVFNFDRMPLDRIRAVSETYNVPMNELRKTYPKIYERLLRSKAIPFIRDMRNEYYVDVLNTYMMLRDMGREGDGFRNIRMIKEKFDNLIDSLQLSEQLLIKAAKGTSLEVLPVGKYDPSADIEKILSGQIKPSIGKYGYRDMNALAKESGCRLKYQSVDIEKFTTEPFEDFNYSAFIRGDKGQVIVGYLEHDYEALKPVFDSFKLKKNLKSKIEAAEQRCNKPKPAISENISRAGR